jgi:hypothetical protein
LNSWSGGRYESTIVTAHPTLFNYLLSWLLSGHPKNSKGFTDPGFSSSECHQRVLKFTRDEETGVYWLPNKDFTTHHVGTSSIKGKECTDAGAPFDWPRE